MDDSALDDIDADIAAAVAHRTLTWRKLVLRDDQPNRDAYRAADTELNRLLEMRYEMALAERASA